MKPKTNPTITEKAKMVVELKRLTTTFTSTEISIMAKCSVNTVRQWKMRDRVSAVAARQMEKHKTFKEYGFSKQALRPDVKIWY